MTYVAQDKPFLHIDNDTFLFESRLVGNSYPITFSFPDINQPLNMKITGNDAQTKPISILTLN